MDGVLLPLFPLQVVLLPRTALPLHIFEERYKEMIGEILESGGEFGVVLGRNDGVVNVGCAARVRRVLRQHEDGRLDILCVGVRRFRILDIDEQRSFVRARVEPVEDDDPRPVMPEHVRAALTAWRYYGEATGEEPVELDEEDDDLSFLLGALSTDLEFRQTLLITRSEVRRLELIAEHYTSLLERWKREQSMKRKAYTNGHSDHWKDQGN